MVITLLELSLVVSGGRWRSFRLALCWVLRRGREGDRGSLLVCGYAPPSSPIVSQGTPHLRTASHEGPLPTHHPSWQKSLAEGSLGAPRSWVSHFLYEFPLFLSLSCSFIHKILLYFPRLSPLWVSLSATILSCSFSLPCPHIPFKSCFNLTSSLSHLCFSFPSAARSA